MSDRQGKTTVNEGTADQEITVGNSDSDSVVSENLVNVRTLKRCFNEKIDKEMDNIVDTVEDRSQNTIWTAIDTIVAPKIELAIKSVSAFSGQGAICVMVGSERENT